MSIDPKPADNDHKLVLERRCSGLVWRNRGAHDVVQGRAPAVQGYILWGSVESRAKGKAQPEMMSIEESWSEVLPCRCSGLEFRAGRLEVQIRSRWVT